MTVTELPPSSSASDQNESYADHVWLPVGVGRCSERMHRLLHGCAGHLPEPVQCAGEGFFDSDFQLALWMYFTARNGGFVDADADAVMSRAVEDAGWLLRAEFERRMQDVVDSPDSASATLAQELDRLSSSTSAARAPQTSAETVRLFLSKAPYLAWEADPHSVALARMPDDVKTPFAEIQAGEYGVGHRETHAALYRGCLAALGTDVQTALHLAPAAGFALANSAWFFSLDHRYAGAALGQLCLFETDSVEPARRQIAEWDRNRLPAAGRRWYDVHVLADSEHSDIVAASVLPAIERNHPELIEPFVRGARLTAAIFDDLDRAVVGRRRVASAV